MSRKDSAGQGASRRAFLKSAAVAAGSAATLSSPGIAALAAQEQSQAGGGSGNSGEEARSANGSSGNQELGHKPPPAPTGEDRPPTGTMPLRPFGKASGVSISALGCGGHHLGDAPSVGEAIDLIHEAQDNGVTFFDNCWEYYNGKTEDWLGRALATENRRDRAFVMTKVCTHGRDADLALRMLEQSLRRLQTDHVDLWQIHAVTYDNDPELAYRPGGVLEALAKAKQQGKTRFVGFTGHKDPGIHLKMIQMGFPFDSVQMPLNPFDYHFFSFERQVLPEVQKRGMAALGMKSMGGQGEPIEQGVVTAEELLRYAMSLPGVTTTIAGMPTRAILRQNLKVALNFQPMGEAERQALRERCAQAAGDGRFEPYKVSLRYDNPETRQPHGFPIDNQQREVQEIFRGGAANAGSVSSR